MVGISRKFAPPASVARVVFSGNSWNSTAIFRQSSRVDGLASAKLAVPFLSHGNDKFQLGQRGIIRDAEYTYIYVRMYM